MSDGNGHNPATQLPPDIILEAQELSKSGEGIVEVRALEVDADSGGTTQPDADIWTPQDTIEPPENLPWLNRLTKASQIRGICIGALARNTVGLGWEIGVWPEHEGQVDKQTIRDARHHLDALARRDKRLDRPSFSDLMYAVKRDLEEYGNAAIEASRNRRTGKLTGLFHLPGQKLRRKSDRSGWVMGQNPELVDDSSRIDYYNFGEKVEYDEKGNPQPRLQTPGKGWKRNEVIHFRHYTSESRDYGLPRDIDLTIEYVAVQAVTEWTQSFFKGSGVPPTMLFVQGTEQKTGNRIRYTVNDNVLRRIQQAMKTDSSGDSVVVVPVPPGTQVHAEQLSKLSDRDITFDEFKKAHRRNSGAAFGLMPIFYGDVDDSGRYTAEVQRALTLEETFDPDQRYVEDKMWTTVLADCGYSELRLIFKRLAVEADSARREIANNGADRGAITVGEWRNMNGLSPLPSELEPDDPKNPNNERFAQKSGGGNPHDPVDQKSQDQRGQRPGIGGRTERDEQPVAKEGEHGEPHVEEAVDELADELGEYGPVSVDA